MMPLLVIDVNNSFIINFYSYIVQLDHYTHPPENCRTTQGTTNNNSHRTTNDEKIHHHQSYLKVFYIAPD